jgi:hypothetical protein
MSASRKVLISDIKYDDDVTDLPETMEASIPFDSNTEESDDLEDKISDHISDTTGFCHLGFSWKFID